MLRTLRTEASLHTHEGLYEIPNTPSGEGNQSRRNGRGWGRVTQQLFILSGNTDRLSTWSQDGCEGRGRE